MSAADTTTEFVPVELQDTERESFLRALDQAAPESQEGIGLFTRAWMSARAAYGDQSGIHIDVVHAGLERLAEIATEADKPLHRNEMRVDWANSLGAGEQRYIMSLRGTLATCANIAREMIDRGRLSCTCLREPGTNSSCPVHQLAADES